MQVFARKLGARIVLTTLRYMLCCHIAAAVGCVMQTFRRDRDRGSVLQCSSLVSGKVQAVHITTSQGTP